MKINKPAFFSLIVYPAILIVMLMYYVKYFGFGKLELIYLLLGYYVTNSFIGIAMHRFYSHDAFKTTKFVEYIFCFFTAAAMQGPIIAWAADHRRHHAYTDKELDPHTPKKYTNKIKGFLWSHIGWMLFKEIDANKLIDAATMKKFAKNKIAIWQLKNYWKLVWFMNIIPPLLLGYVFTKSAIGAFSGFLFIGIGRALQQQITFCVNSVCHFWGDAIYSSGSAKNVWWLAPLLVGENYHNFHHAFPSDYRNGVRWYQFDFHKWTIYLMSKLGLAWDLDVTSEVRIQAKIQDTKKQQVITQWKTLSQMYEELQHNVFLKIAEIENKGSELKSVFMQNLYELKTKSESIINDIKFFIEQPEKSSQDLIQSSMRTFNIMQKSFETIIPRLV